MREPCAMKVARTVLRGEGSSNGAFLPYTSPNTQVVSCL